MRIISGSLGGREIRSPQGPGTRPAMARTREALFSMLDAREVNWPEIKVLDLFAGSGSLAFEALSRGAATATFVDNSVQTIKAINQNVAAFDLDERCRVINEDVLRFLRKPGAYPFNMVFVDPPYRRDYASPVFAKLISGNWLANDAIIVAELESGAKISVPEAFSELCARAFGQTLLKIWIKT